MGIIAVLLLLYAVSYIGTLGRTIARERLTVNGYSITASVLRDGQIVFGEFLTQTSIYREGGRLLAVSASPGRTGVVIMRRNPTDAEEHLWKKYFATHCRGDDNSV